MRGAGRDGVVDPAEGGPAFIGGGTGSGQGSTGFSSTAAAMDVCGDVLPNEEVDMGATPQQVAAHEDEGPGVGTPLAEATEPGGEGSPAKWRRLDPQSRQELTARSLLPGAMTSKQDFHSMFQNLKTIWTSQTRQTHGTMIGRSYDIMLDTANKMDYVHAYCTSWDIGRVRLGAAALHLYNRRLSDLSERDHVQLVWCACGGEQVRVHEGGQVWICR